MDGNLGWTHGWTGGYMNNCIGLRVLPKGYFFANLLVNALSLI